LPTKEAHPSVLELLFSWFLTLPVVVKGHCRSFTGVGLRSRTNSDFARCKGIAVLLFVLIACYLVLAGALQGLLVCILILRLFAKGAAGVDSRVFKLFTGLLIALMLMSSLSVDTISSRGSNVRFKRPLPTAHTNSSFESQRVENVRRNAQMRALLVPDALQLVPPKTKMPVFSKKVKKVPAAARVQPVRATKSRTPHRSKKSTVTQSCSVSKKGAWICVKGCGVVSPTIEAFLTHLKGSHALPLEVQYLAPLGLALCPHCSGVYASFRGLANHVRSCDYPRVSVAIKEGGPFPKTCFVWWSSEDCWYEGLASVSDKIDCWNVVYPDSDEIFVELCHLVSFIPPPRDASLLSLGGLVTPEGGVDQFSVDPSLSPISVGSVKPFCKCQSKLVYECVSSLRLF